MLEKKNKLNNLHVNFITDETGRKQSVIMSMKDYEELVEDYTDLTAIVSRKDDECSKRTKKNSKNHITTNKKQTI